MHDMGNPGVRSIAVTTLANLDHTQTFDTSRRLGGGRRGGAGGILGVQQALQFTSGKGATKTIEASFLPMEYGQKHTSSA